MTFLEFLRAFKTSGAEPTRYKLKTQIAVDIRYVSFSSDLCCFHVESLALLQQKQCIGASPSAPKA